MAQSRDPVLDAAGLPVGPPGPVVTHQPVRLATPGRPVDLELRVTVPAQADGELPVVVFSHGHGGSMFTASMYGYEPLVLFWAARGFAVLQPNHLDASFLGLREADDSDAPLYLRRRFEDVEAVIDRLDEVRDALPRAGWRFDGGRVGVVGHSAGGNTVSLVAGATVEVGGQAVGRVDERVGARVLIAPPGLGGDIASWAGTNYPALGTTSFAGMTADALVVAGEHDHTELFSEREDWRSDAFVASPPPKTRLCVRGAEHMFGGISGFDTAETTDEDPARVAVVRAMVWAYLHSRLFSGDSAWEDCVSALAATDEPAGWVESR